LIKIPQVFLKNRPFFVFSCDESLADKGLFRLTTLTGKNYNDIYDKKGCVASDRTKRYCPGSVPVYYPGFAHSEQEYIG
jgi:hypothetical protein